MKKIGRKLYLIGDVDEVMLRDFSETLDGLENQNKKPIYIELNSGGGTAVDGMAIAARIHNSPCKIHVHVNGVADSAAVIIAASGHTRSMTESSTMLLHEDSAEISGTTSELERRVKELRTRENTWNRLLEVYTNTSASFWDELHRADLTLTAKQCLAHNLTQKIISKAPVKRAKK